MFKKYLVVASKKDEAGINITTALSQFKSNKFEFYIVDEEILNQENLDLDKINKNDFIIFASRHSSEKQQKTLSVHAPGNFKKALMGRKPEELSSASAIFQKQLFINLDKFAKEYHLEKKYNVTLEVTHHGPLIERPCVFIEIGSTLNEWKDKKAGFVIAKTILETIKNFRENPYNEIVIGIGGPHYCPNFNKIQLKSNYALAHIIPGYVLPLTDKMVEECIKKTIEDVDLAIIDWKGIPNAEERKRILEIFDKHYLRYRKTSEIKKEL